MRIKTILLSMALHLELEILLLLLHSILWLTFSSLSLAFIQTWSIFQNILLQGYTFLSILEFLLKTLTQPCFETNSGGNLEMAYSNLYSHIHCMRAVKFNVIFEDYSKLCLFRMIAFIAFCLFSIYRRRRILTRRILYLGTCRLGAKKLVKMRT